MAYKAKYKMHPSKVEKNYSLKIFLTINEYFNFFIIFIPYRLLTNFFLSIKEKKEHGRTYL
jgi:hypothetical protein